MAIEIQQFPIKCHSYHTKPFPTSKEKLSFNGAIALPYHEKTQHFDCPVQPTYSKSFIVNRSHLEKIYIENLKFL